jgi:hypothetical protein
MKAKLTRIGSRSPNLARSSTSNLGNRSTLSAVDIATITGVGSSALGSAALAWDISVALQKPVLAIVAGYGVADVFLQALGGWFAFGLTISSAASR